MLLESVLECVYSNAEILQIVCVCVCGGGGGGGGGGGVLEREKFKIDRIEAENSRTTLN